MRQNGDDVTDEQRILVSLFETTTKTGFQRSFAGADEIPPARLGEYHPLGIHCQPGCSALAATAASR